MDIKTFIQNEILKKRLMKNPVLLYMIRKCILMSYTRLWHLINQLLLMSTCPS
jgi:hypothetical protein